MTSIFLYLNYLQTELKKRERIFSNWQLWPKRRYWVNFFWKEMKRKLHLLVSSLFFTRYYWFFKVEFFTFVLFTYTQTYIFTYMHLRQKLLSYEIIGTIFIPIISVFSTHILTEHNQSNQTKWEYLRKSKLFHINQFSLFRILREPWTSSESSANQNSKGVTRRICGGFLKDLIYV